MALGERPDLQKVAALIKQGLRPAQIANDLNISLDKILDFIHEAVSRDLVRASEVLRCVPEAQRQAIAGKAEAIAFRTTYEVRRLLEKGNEASLWGSRSAMVLDIDLVLKYRHGGVLLGELYEDLREIEVSLHRFLRQVLLDAYGSNEVGWWVQGIPQGVRIKCQERRESDSARLDPYCYTDLLDLYDVIDKRWALVEEPFSALAKSKKDVLDAIHRLNLIRNSVMHPVRGVVPDEADFEFVRSLRAVIHQITFTYYLDATKGGAGGSQGSRR